jgi:hypothetical protein
MMPMHLIIDLARDLAIVAIELAVLTTAGWCLSRKSAGENRAGKFGRKRGEAVRSNARPRNLMVYTED